MNRVAHVTHTSLTNCCSNSHANAENTCNNSGPLTEGYTPFTHTIRTQSHTVREPQCTHHPWSRGRWSYRRSSHLHTPESSRLQKDLPATPAAHGLLAALFEHVVPS